MQVYNAPLRDMRFVLHELHQGDGFGGLARFKEFTPDVLDAMIEEAARMATEVCLPLNAVGDQEGCQFENGSVRTPKGFKAAFDAYRNSGWCALSGDPEFGGQGAPRTLHALAEETISSTNIAFGLYTGLTHGAATALEGHGSEALKQQYMPNMVSAHWAATMCLTEAHCGSDLGMLRTRAVPQADGSYRISGSKIFISAGEHDLAENIIHLVLARLPDAPAGVKGISLFLVPKLIPDANNKPGERNGVLCTGIEHKMGLKGSATCQMTFDNALGWMVGEPNKGMAAMFTMMNTERVSVGIQGLGVAEAAYQAAVAYAKERVQGRSLSGAKRPDLPADPLIVHPDVRRMLMTMRAYTEGCRALGGWVARALDAEKHSEDPAVKQRAADFVALMTPVVKALFTDLGFEAANLGLQVYGGHGYIREHGVEQYVRDARILLLYEGTNGIQALDLVGRKLRAEMGRYLQSFLQPIAQQLAETQEPSLAPMKAALSQAFEALQTATATLAERGFKDPEEAGAAATDYLRLFGLVGIGYCFLRAAKIATAKLAAGDEDAEFYRDKLVTAAFFHERILPQTASLLAAIKAGKGSMMAIEW
jgi:alkylation response protein AidB-like acyl-CoA dehydrogenase